MNTRFMQYILHTLRLSESIDNNQIMIIDDRTQQETNNDSAHSHSHHPNQLHETLQDMYNRTPYQVTTIESYEMDCLLKYLITPAHHALYTLHHAFRYCRDCEKALFHCQHLLKADHCFIFNTTRTGTFTATSTTAALDATSTCIENNSKDNDDENDNDTYSYLHIDDSLLEPGAYFNIIKRKDEKNIPHGWSIVQTKKSISTKKIIQRFMSMSNSITTKSEHTSYTNQNLQLLKELYLHLYISLGTDVRDGIADIALSLSMIPIFNQAECTQMKTIMDALVHTAALEITRRQTKLSRRSVEILMIVEKLAAAGCQGRYFIKALNAAKKSLPGSVHYETISQGTMDGLMDMNFWSSRSLLWLWRRGHVFHKVSERDSRDALTVQDIFLNPPEFDDPSLPLVVDIGCGLGVTLIGLAAVADGVIGSYAYQYHLDLNWCEYNYLGSDLSSKAMQWATSLTMRRGLTGRCQFLHTSTDTLLEYLDKTNADTKLLLLQFPTPYRLQEKILSDTCNENEASASSGNKGSGCNEKLPLGPDDPSFMANPEILQQMVHLLKRYQVNHEKEAYLLLQSNCEDVALHLHDCLLSMDLEAKDSECPRYTFDGSAISSRTRAWLESQQQSLRNMEDIRRAVGLQWPSRPLIPIQTETEVSSDHQGTPVHRCLFNSSCKDR